MLDKGGSTVVEGGLSSVVVEVALSQSLLDPWVATLRIWQPRPARAPANSRKGFGSNLDSFGPSSSLSSPSSPALGEASLSSPLNSNGWQKLMKYASR